MKDKSAFVVAIISLPVQGTVTPAGGELLIELPNPWFMPPANLSSRCGTCPDLDTKHTFFEQVCFPPQTRVSARDHPWKREAN